MLNNVDKVSTQRRLRPIILVDFVLIGGACDIPANDGHRLAHVHVRHVVLALGGLRAGSPSVAWARRRAPRQCRRTCPRRAGRLVVAALGGRRTACGLEAPEVCLLDPQFADCSGAGRRTAGRLCQAACVVRTGGGATTPALRRMRVACPEAELTSALACLAMASCARARCPKDAVENGRQDRPCLDDPCLAARLATYPLVKI